MQISPLKILSPNFQAKKIKTNTTLPNDSFSYSTSLPFKSPKSARQLIYKRFGVEVDEIKDMQEAKIIYEALDELTKLNYKGTGDKLFKNLKITHEELKEDDYPSEELFGKSFSRNFQVPDHIGAKRDNGTITEKDFYNVPKNKLIKTGKPVIILNSLFDAAGSKKRMEENPDLHPYSELKYIMMHELAHTIHYEEMSVKEIFLLDTLPFDTSIAQEISSYACTSPDDFVAEYIAGRMAGKVFSKDVDEQYEILHGPKLFN